MAVTAGTGVAPEVGAQGSDQVVFVEVNEGGQVLRQGVGITRKRGDECFVVAADHVVRGDAPVNPDDREAPETIWVVASNERRIPAVYKMTLPRDIAILRVNPENPHAATLCANWPRVASLERLDRRAQSESWQSGEVLGRDREGNRTSLPVTVARVALTTGEVTVRPDSGKGDIQPGMSGSLVLVDGIAAGILRNEVSGAGIVQSLESLEPDIARYLDIQFPPSRRVIRLSLVIPGRGQIATRREGLGTAWFVATAAASVTLFMVSSTETRIEVFDDEFGIPRSYPYDVREFPLRWYAPAVWLFSGAVSTLEAGRAARNYPGLEEPPAAARTSLRLTAFPTVVDGEPAFTLAVRLSF